MSIQAQFLFYLGAFVLLMIDALIGSRQGIWYKGIKLISLGLALWVFIPLWITFKAL